jgi:hypothetical protein
VEEQRGNPDRLNDALRAGSQIVVLGVLESMELGSGGVVELPERSAGQHGVEVKDVSQDFRLPLTLARRERRK